MFINKFNKLIRNKWIWGIFAVCVCFLFAASDLFGRGGGGRAENSAGTLGGEPVSYEELQVAGRAVAIEEFFSRIDPRHPMYRPPRISSEGDAAVRARMFVAAARAALEEGFRVSEQELLDQIAMFFTPPDGTFSQEYYERGVYDLFRWSTLEFENAYRLYLLVDKVRSVHSLANWVSEPVADAQSASLTDRCTIRTALLTNAFENASIDLTDEALADFYEKEGALYTEPRRVRVRYVRFAIADYAGDVKDPTEDDLRYLYDDGPDRYRGEVDGVMTNLSFEAARPQLEEEYRKKQAVDVAKRAASGFSDNFYVDARHRKESEAALLDPAFFEARAAAAGLTVSTTAYFAASSPVPGIPEALQGAFSKAAFAMDSTDAYHAYGDELLSDDDAFYALAFGDVVDEHIPPYEEVADRVRADYVTRERNALFSRASDQAMKDFEIRIKDKSLDDVAAELGLSVSTNLVVTPTTASLPGPSGMWLHDLTSLAKDSWSPLRPVPEGAMLLYMVDREEGDDYPRHYTRERIIENERARLAFTLSEDWLKANYAAMKPQFRGERSVADEQPDEK